MEPATRASSNTAEHHSSPADIKLDDNIWKDITLGNIASRDIMLGNIASRHTVACRAGWLVGLCDITLGNIASRDIRLGNIASRHRGLSGRVACRAV